MRTIVTARQFTLTPAIESYAEEKVERMVPSGEQAGSIHIILAHERYLYTAELVFHLGQARGRAKATAKDLYAAINLAVKKCHHELDHQLGKIRARAKGGRSASHADLAHQEEAAIEKRTGHKGMVMTEPIPAWVDEERIEIENREAYLSG